MTFGKMFKKLDYLPDSTKQCIPVYSGGSKRGRVGFAPPLGPISFIFMQFSAKKCRMIGWRPFWKTLDSTLIYH